MQQAVDVLADLDWLSQWLSDTTPQGGEAAFETVGKVRAAVAELIEADREYDRIRWEPYDRHDPVASREGREEFIAAQERRENALARIDPDGAA